MSCIRQIGVVFQYHDLKLHLFFCFSINDSKSVLYMLICGSILSLVQSVYFPLFLGMVMYENEFKTREIKFKPRIKLSHNIIHESQRKCRLENTSVTSTIFEFQAAKVNVYLMYSITIYRSYFRIRE